MVPGHDGLGVRPNGRVVDTSPPPPSVSLGNLLEKVTLTVSVFGPELVSYEISQRETTAKLHDFSARVFFEMIPNGLSDPFYGVSGKI